jgi:hypothetical protein
LSPILHQKRGFVRRSKNLADCELQKPYRIARILDQEPQFLHFINESGLMPGTRVVVQSRDLVAEFASVVPENQSAVTIGTAAAAKILVQAV